MSLLGDVSHSHHIHIFLFALVTCFLMFAPTMRGTAQGFTIKKFTTLSPNLTQAEKHQKLIRISKARALNLQASMTVANSLGVPLVPNAISAPLHHAFSGFFYAEISIGTPPQKANLAIDTGSSPTWVQWAACETCFPTSSPNFNDIKSTSYRDMANNNPICVPPTLSPFGSGCIYGVANADDSSSNGFYGLDTYTLGQETISNVAFGLGKINLIDFDDRYHEQPNPIIGQMGLGRGDGTSILQQKKEVTLGRFSYCLRSLFESQTSLLHSGNDAQIVGGVSTPILGSPNSYYFVRLNSISFNGQPLPIDPNLFTCGGGVVVDTGTPYTQLVKDAYDILEKAVTGYLYNLYQWRPLPPDPDEEFGLCYGTIPTQYTVPSIRLHLDGGDIQVLNPLFEALENSDEFCMTILSGGEDTDTNILGATQQVNHRFLFDVVASRLSFAPENC